MFDTLWHRSCCRNGNVRRLVAIKQKKLLNIHAAFYLFFLKECVLMHPKGHQKVSAVDTISHFKCTCNLLQAAKSHCNLSQAKYKQTTKKLFIMTRRHLTGFI